MNTPILRQLDFDKDLAAVAALFVSEMDEAESVESLRKFLEEHGDRNLGVHVAVDEKDNLVGFNWLFRDKEIPERAQAYLVVQPECRKQGVGRLLLADLENAARQAGILDVRSTVPDKNPEYLRFAKDHACEVLKHVIGMELNPALLDLEPFKNLVQALEAQGFHFTSMLALGDTPGARENLFRLNDTASSQTMGSDGEHSWTDFEDFNQSVCESDWYKPAGQLVVIERHTGRWVAMSAITRFEGSDYAYNLFTGVDEDYRSRGLARAVKALALEYARDNLGVTRVRTHHLEANLPMIAVDRHLGYEVIPGYYTVRKVLPGMPGG